MIIMTRLSAKIPHFAVAVALGSLAVIGVNDAWGAMERHRCKGLTTTHQVVALRGFWGHTTYCVDRRYL
jgi:hypothetical protein